MRDSSENRIALEIDDSSYIFIRCVLQHMKDFMKIDGAKFRTGAKRLLGPGYQFPIEHSRFAPVLNSSSRRNLIRVGESIHYLLSQKSTE